MVILLCVTNAASILALLAVIFWPNSKSTRLLEVDDVTEPMRPDPKYSSGTIMLPSRPAHLVTVSTGRRIETWHLREVRSAYGDIKLLATRESDGVTAGDERTAQLRAMLDTHLARKRQEERLLGA